MEYLDTPEFQDAYLRPPDDEADLVYEAIARILRDPTSAEVRSGRLRGGGSERFDQAWIRRFKVRGRPHNLYWDCMDNGTLVLILFFETR